MSDPLNQHPKFYTITFDDNKQEYMWANDEAHVVAKCLEEYPSAEVTEIFLNNREPVIYK